jgi:hypothetical protein
MEDPTTTIEKLIEKAEIYSKTTLELYKYYAVYKTASIFSDLAVKIIMSIVVVFFSLLITIGTSLWIGKELGETYYGFFITGAVFILLAVLLLFFKERWIKIPVSNFIINKMKEENI